jgi:uncharacterized membrane protein
MIALPAWLPPWAGVLIVAAIPIGELRAAIPLGILGFGMSPSATFLIANIGNALPILAVYGFGAFWLRIVERRRGFLHRLTDRVLKRTHAAFKDSYGAWGLIALTAFVAVPLPFTGAWSGALAAFLFGIPFRKAFPLIVLGNLIAGIIVTLAVTCGVTLFRAFL